MKRKLALFSMAALLLVSAAGCSGGDTSKETESTDTQVETESSEPEKEEIDEEETADIKKGEFLKEINQEISKIHKQFSTGYSEDSDAETGATKIENLSEEAKAALEELYQIREEAEKFKGESGEALQDLYKEFIKIKDRNLE